MNTRMENNIKALFVVGVALAVLFMLSACGGGGTSVGVDRSGTIAISQTEGSGPLGVTGGGSNTTVLDPNAPVTAVPRIQPVPQQCPVFHPNTGELVCSCASFYAGEC